MKHLATVLMLILASTNASKYYQPDRHRLQQDSISGYGRPPHPLSGPPDLLPEFSPMDEWEFPPDPRTILLENLLFRNEAGEEDRMKRMKTSLSIDNPLDVLRQQYYRALARRMKYKSIEKNREHLIKTGKRSAGESDRRINFDKPRTDFATESSSPARNPVENVPDETETNYSILEGNESNRRNGNRLNDVSSYQT